MNLNQLIYLPSDIDFLVKSLKELELTQKGICLSKEKKVLIDKAENPIHFSKVYFLNATTRDNGYCIPFGYRRFHYQEKTDEAVDLQYLLYNKEDHSFSIRSLSGYDSKLFEDMNFDINSNEFLSLISQNNI